jgi:hypothetical protein
LILLCLPQWVPINFAANSFYYSPNILQEFAPRSIFGSLLQALPGYRDDSSLMGNYLKLASIFTWLFIVLCLLYRSVFIGNKVNNVFSKAYVYLGLAFIFSTNPIVFLTLSSTGVIDAFPSAIIAFVVMLIYSQNNSVLTFNKILLINILLVIAVLSHEKSLYDIAILAVWFFVILGFKKSFLLFLPAVLTAGITLYFIAHKITTGEAPSAYMELFLSGFSFFWYRSFNFWGILLGGGVLWILYGMLGFKFIGHVQVNSSKIIRLFAVILMGLFCLLPLLVAWDTNRLVALIWLPTILMFQEISAINLFDSRAKKGLLAFVCMSQALIPPMMIYDKGYVPFNCYAQAIGNYFPSREQYGECDGCRVPGPFRLELLRRPDLTSHFSDLCVN